MTETDDGCDGGRCLCPVCLTRDHTAAIFAQGLFNHTILTVWENFRLESSGYVPRSPQGGNGRDFVLDKLRETALQEPLQCHQQRAPTLWPLPPSFLLKSAPCWTANETWPTPISSGQRVLPRSMFDGWCGSGAPASCRGIGHCWRCRFSEAFATRTSRPQ